ncbi:MAG: hypothetical protein COW13_00075 [Candidatus Omnitrophica bacterium CG12_big_fil_rev_8_21_14_0_65_50_5]|nr:MAG: hypothetical protein COW13_00075 [Candidatus Omnitrophica bacterium CG12_big_fil_rev_8_21_14_0_65_50_5]
MTLTLNRLKNFQPRKGPLLLIIMDGVGLGKRDESDGVFLAKTPCLDRLMQSPLYTTLKAHGTAVGMPSDCYMGKIGLINSGGASGVNDLADAAKTAVINKRAGGMGLICGRKAFQKPFKQGIEILNTIQDVYLSKEVTIA